VISLLLYYLIIPIVAGAAVVAFIKKYGKHGPPEDVAALLAARPMEPKTFRAVRRDHRGVRILGDFETQPEAVEAAYRGKEEALAEKEHAAFLVLNAKGEILEETDS
jgi:hypothetical protein